MHVIPSVQVMQPAMGSAQRGVGEGHACTHSPSLRSNIGEPPEGATPVEGEEPREKVIYEIVQERFDEIDADGDGAL